MMIDENAPFLLNEVWSCLPWRVGTQVLEDQLLESAGKTLNSANLDQRHFDEELWEREIETIDGH